MKYVVAPPFRMQDPVTCPIPKTGFIIHIEDLNIYLIESKTNHIYGPFMYFGEDEDVHPLMDCIVKKQLRDLLENELPIQSKTNCGKPKTKRKSGKVR